MVKDNLGFQLPNLEEFIELSPLTIPPETMVIDAIALMNQPREFASNSHSGRQYVSCFSYLLIEESASLSLLGILTERDIVKLCATEVDLKFATVGELITTKIVTFKKSDFQDIYQVMSILQSHKIKYLPVVDDDKKLVGIVSSEGICRALNPTNLLKLRSVEDVINTVVLQAPSTTSVLGLSQLMAEQDRSCVVIVETNSSTERESLTCSGEEYSYLGTPIGIVTERDIVQFQILGLDLANSIAETVMSTPLIHIKPTDSLLSVQQQMKDRRVRRLVVFGESGELRGIVSAQDMLRVLNIGELYSVIDTLKQELNQQTKHLRLEIEQREKSEVMLRKNQQLLELFVRRAPAAIAMLDRQLNYMVVSDRWIQDYQLKEKDIIGRNHYEIFPELPERWKQDHQDVLTGRCRVLKNKEDSFVRPNGRVDWLRWELFPWHDSAGKIGGLLMFCDVITERKLLELKLQSSEAQMRAMFEAMTDLVLTIELAHNSIQILPTSFTKLDSTGDRNRTIVQTNLQLFHGASAENYHRLIQQIIETQQAVDLEYSLVLDGSPVWFSVNISPLSETIVIWVARNITSRKEMEQTLYAEKELAQVTLKSIGDGVITTDAEGIVKFVNPVAERLTGWRGAEAQGKPLVDIFQIVNQFTREPVVNPVDVVLRTNRIYELASDTLLVSKEGCKYAIEDSAAPIQDRQGKLIGAVIVFHDVTQSRNLAHKLSWQATHDTLTGLYNRRKFETQLDLAIEDSKNNQTIHALCFFDLDRFKIINDTCGHAAGDELLRQITQLLKQRIRDLDIFSRLGGDEFGLLLHRCSTEAALRLANQLRQLIQDFCFVWEDRIFRIGVSIGLVSIDSATANLAEVLNCADAACYAAKEKGRNCVHLYEEDTVVAKQRGQGQWIAKINRALSENLCLDTLYAVHPICEVGSHRFCLYAQKIIALQDNCNSCHYEILLRLIDESGKIIAPNTFLPVAERYDLMPAIDRWVVTTFFANYQYYQSSQKQELKSLTDLYTINLSGASINSREFGTFLQEQFARYAIAPETICFEITETIAISNLNNAVILMEKLKKLGCSIALDDFGSGMCSLNYLKNLPVDYLKIDGGFVKNIASDRLNYATVEYFHRISQMMGIKTIAEFVENDVILNNITSMGIDYAQGYGIELPRPLGV